MSALLPHNTQSDPLLPGVEYHTTGVLRTKPGRGDPTRSMCCADKLARWNVLGMQGALLAWLMHPIYLDTISVGEYFDQVGEGGGG